MLLVSGATPSAITKQQVNSTRPKMSSINRREWLGKVGGITAGALMGQLVSTNASASNLTTSQGNIERETETKRWLELAGSLKPTLRESVLSPTAIIRPIPDSSRFLRWRMETVAPAFELEKKLFRRGDSVILDFGEHRTGYLSFRLIGEGIHMDAPTRLRLTFGEVPGDVADDLYPYNGDLSEAWLPDELFNIDDLPQTVHVSRRHAFRYLKLQVIDTSPKYAARFQNIQIRTVTSAQQDAPTLGSDLPEALRLIDTVSLSTLRDCMQTVFEDGPRRDQRLWIGDMRLQALTNYVTFKNYDLVKRCLYLFASLPREDGLLAACVFERPRPTRGGDYIMDYAVLYGAALLDYVRASGDTATGRDLWPVVRRQLEIIGQNVDRDGLFVDPRNFWIFIDWNNKLDRTAAMHGVLLYSYKCAIELARVVGTEKDTVAYKDQITRMTNAARSHFFDRDQGLFVSGPDRQVSWASQAWLILAGVCEKQEAAAAIKNTVKLPSAVRPVTPYLYHHVVEAMVACGIKNDAKELVQSYWGGMVAAGADTFWEVYDPADPLLSPYGTVHINSYCHAWSCTPAYFIRTMTLGS